MKKENVVANKTIIWTVVFFVIAISLSILNLIYSNCTGIKIASLVAVSFLPLWYFFKGREAHKWQNDKLKEIYDILTGSSTSDITGFKMSRNLVKYMFLSCFMLCTNPFVKVPLIIK